MKFRIGAITLSLSLALVVAYFVLGMLTNYATNNIPRIVVDYPWVVWGGIIAIIVIISGLNMIMPRLFQSTPHRAVVKSILESEVENMENEFKYDAFISYSHEDAQWVHTRLIPYLLKHDLKVFSDEEFEGGAHGIKEMERGVVASRRVVAVLSDAYIRSEWSTFENVMAQSTDPAAKERKLVPVLLEKCAIPLRLKILHYRDLSTDDPVEWKRLIEDII